MKKPIFASRVFDLDSGRGGRIELRVYAPRAVDRAYECDFTVTHDGEVIGGHPTLGEDAVQALLLALGLAAVEVEIAITRRHAHVEPWLLADLKSLASEQAKAVRKRRPRSSSPKEAPKTAASVRRKR